MMERYMSPWGPIHDKFCRCPACKPELRAARIRWLAIAAAIIVGALLGYFL
jgi:hypothetical protein